MNNENKLFAFSCLFAHKGCRTFHRMRYTIGTLCILAAFFCCYSFVQKAEANKTEAKEILQIRSSEKNVSFDFLRFSQQWPPSICEDPDKQHCVVPNNTNFWTIHGLWPDTYNDSAEPSFCNNTWKFNETQILPIEDELLLRWPDLMDGKMSKTFWKHEWSKHGTCTADLQPLDTILKYFRVGLDLTEKLNILDFLAKSGIEPNNATQLELQTISDAMSDYLSVRVRVMCSFKKIKLTKRKKQSDNKSQPLLSSIDICMDKGFELMDCPDFNSTNCPTSGIFYIPITL